MTEISLPYGCNQGIPKGVRVAWGARLIWPDDLVPDRQGCDGAEPGGPERNELLDWLASGAGDAARAEARRMANDWELSPDSDTTVTLYEDERGIVIGNPQSSFGYLYVAAWLKKHIGATA